MKFATFKGFISYLLAVILSYILLYSVDMNMYLHLLLHQPPFQPLKIFVFSMFVGHTST